MARRAMGLLDRMPRGTGRFNFVSGLQAPHGVVGGEAMALANDTIERFMPGRGDPMGLFSAIRRDPRQEESPDEIRQRVAMDGLRRQLMGGDVTGDKRELALADLRELQQQQAAKQAAGALNMQWQGEVGNPMAGGGMPMTGGRSPHARHLDKRQASVIASQVAAGQKPAITVPVPTAGQTVAPSQQQRKRAATMHEEQLREGQQEMSRQALAHGVSPEDAFMRRVFAGLRR